MHRPTQLLREAPKLGSVTSVRPGVQASSPSVLLNYIVNVVMHVSCLRCPKITRLLPFFLGLIHVGCAECPKRNVCSPRALWGLLFPLILCLFCSFSKGSFLSARGRIPETLQTNRTAQKPATNGSGTSIILIISARY